MKELKEQVLLQLASSLAPLEFRANRPQQSFRRTFPGGHEIFHVSFIPHPADLDITADVAIRFDEIEQHLNARRPHLSDRDKKWTATIGGDLGNLSGTGQRRWTVAGVTDIPPAVASILASFRDIGEAFFLRFRSLAELRRVLANEPSLARLICPGADNRTQVAEYLNEPRTHVA